MEKFGFVMPAELSKSEDGDWKISGLASTEDVDRQGEVIIQKGVDLTPIDQGKGWFNLDHLPGVENLVGTIDGYQRSAQGIYVHGRLFKNHEKSKAIYNIMSSLNKAQDKSRVGMSVEGRILQRDPLNPKRILKCQIDKVAITLNPVNTNTFVDLVKSMSAADSMEFEAIESNYAATPEEAKEVAMFTASQVVQIVQKALGVGAGSAEAPNTRSGGDALQVSSMSEKKEDKPDTEGAQKEYEPTSAKSRMEKLKLRKMPKEDFKKSMVDILDQLEVLYPQISRPELWKALQNRIETKF